MSGSSKDIKKKQEDAEKREEESEEKLKGDDAGKERKRGGMDEQTG